MANCEPEQAFDRAEPGHGWSMERLLPDELKELWGFVTRKQMTEEELYLQQQRGLARYQDTWKEALLLNSYGELKHSMLFELGRYVGCENLAEIEKRCKEAHPGIRAEWDQKVRPGDRESIEAFYDQSKTEIYVNLWWHTLTDDVSPLAYVVALHFGLQRGCRTFLDFGAGVGSSGILFAHHGFDVTLADISSPLLSFSRFRHRMRGLPTPFIDLKTSSLPSTAFDLITAMDVFEHLFDPVEAAENLWRALKPGGFLFGRFHVEPDDERSGHIVRDLQPTFERMRALGLVEVWRDQWLWGHQAFQKQ